MKKWLVLLFAFCFVKGYAQDVYNLPGKVSVRADKQTVDVLLHEIGRQTGYTFTFDVDALKRIGIDHLEAKDESLGHLLRTLNNRFHLDFAVFGKTISARTAAPRSSGGRGWSTVRGRIEDEGSRQPLAGADVEDKTGRVATVTGVDGRFSLEVRDSALTLTITMVGYKSRVLHVKGDAAINVDLEPDVRSMGGVVVEARRKVNNEIALLNERKNSAVVSDGISAQQMERTASITTTQALQRVTGVTVTDDKYVAIRGLGDRAVIAELNGARLSSANPDRSAVPLDLVPAALLDNVIVYKTASPDRPADASAGLIELKTKSIPSSKVLDFSAEVGFNTNVGLGGQYNGFYNGDPGFFGARVAKQNLSPDFLNLSKQYSGGLVQIQQMFIDSRTTPSLAPEAYRVSKIMQSFDPVLTTSYQKASPNQVYTVSFGDTYSILHGHKLGVILSGNYYQRTTDIYNATRNQYSLYQGVVTGSPSIFQQLHIPNFISPDYPRLGNYLSYKENTGTKTLSYGGLAGLTYQFNTRNEVQAQYVGSRGAEEEGSNLIGAWQNTGINFPIYNEVNKLRESFRTFNTYNLQGEHKIVKNWWSPRLNYNLSSSRSTQDDPDYRSTDVADLRTTRFQSGTGVGIGTDTYAFVTGQVHGATADSTAVIVADPNGRQYRKLVETNYNVKVDLSQPFKIGKLDQLLKFGANYLKRDRTFTESVLGLPGSTLGGGDIHILNEVHGNLDQIVSPSYVGLQNPSSYDNEGEPRVGGFLYQIRKSPNNYHGSYETRAFYGMADLHLPAHLRAEGGVRFESTDIQAHVDTEGVYTPANLSTIVGIDGPGQKAGYTTTAPNTRYAVNYKPFYSANLVWAGIKNMNFRLGYSSSLARPELREITNVFEFDPFQFAVIGGNPNLQNQLTQSYDARWEWFTAPGEVLSASVFAKTIQHPLQRVFSYASQGNQSTAPEFPLIRYENDPDDGHVYGVELEARKDLGKLWPGLNHVFFGTNLLLDYSVIDKNPARLDASRINDRLSPSTSPVFEQAPYSINAYLDYASPKSGTNVTASFNMVGARLIQVQLDGTPDIYDRPVPTLDVVFSQRLGKHFVARGFAKNILNPVYKEVYANPGNDGKFHGVEYDYRAYNKGAELMLGLTYQLF